METTLTGVIPHNIPPSRKGQHGGRRPGAGRRKTPSRQFKDAIANINVAEIVANLKDWARGKPVYCPYCDKDTGVYTADTVALQSAIELLNRRLGKVPQSVQLDITETIQLTADQIDLIVERYQIAQRALLGEVIEGEVKVIS